MMPTETDDDDLDYIEEDISPNGFGQDRYDIY
jgi:hypothetical protein